jgi:phosphoglycolate phosphatase
MLFHAVIFDLDGTLLDSLADLADTMNGVLEDQGFSSHPVDAYRTFVGEGLSKLVERVLPPEARIPETVDTTIREMKHRYRKAWVVKTRPYPGVTELLDGLSERGIPMNILSNKLDEFTRIMAQTLLGAWTFKRVAGVHPGIPRKPDPRSALDIARDCGLPPRDFLFLGDTHTDMETAVAAGMFPVGVLWGFRTKEELERSGARKVIRNPKELLTLLS